MSATNFSRKQRFNIGLLAGLLAGVVASALMLILSVTVNGVSLPETMGSALTQLMPASVFDYLHRTIGGDANYYLFYGILVGQCLVFALSGGICNLVVGLVRFKQVQDTEGHLSWYAGVVVALLLWLLTGLIFLPLTGAGVFGAGLDIGVFNTMLSLAVVGLVFGLLFVYLQNWLVERRLRAQGTEISEDAQERNLARRDLLQRGIGIIALGTLGVITWRFITGGVGSVGGAASKLAQNTLSKIVPPPVPNYGTIQTVPHLSAEVTPNDQYYVVSKNLFSDPTVNSSNWKLTVDGLVDNPYTLTYDELLAMPMKKQYESMMCISNDVGGEYMSNGQWEGVPLADLLKRAGSVKQGATKVVLYAADDYSDSIHLSKALEPTTLVAVHMNNVPLPTGHGYPARLLVPGIYGMKHVKWITRINVVNQDYQGYWQQRGWSDPAPIRMTSRIDTPINGTQVTVNKPTYIAGVAFSGNKGISEVDVSLDGGQTWQRATLKQPLSDLTWVLWELPWQPAKAGDYSVVARAVDLEGNVQDPRIAPSAPDGSTGYHTIRVTVH